MTGHAYSCISPTSLGFLEDNGYIHQYQLANTLDPRGSMITANVRMYDFPSQ